MFMMKEPAKHFSGCKRRIPDFMGHALKRCIKICSLKGFYSLLQSSYNLCCYGLNFNFNPNVRLPVIVCSKAVVSIP